jgi:folate-binding protein YgfZ
MAITTPGLSGEAAAPCRLEQPVALLRLQGSDTLRFLHGQSSQDLALARPGAWLSTCCISPTARLRALAEVLVEEQGAVLVITAGDGAALRQSLDRVLFPADAVALGPLEPGRWLEPLGGEEPRSSPRTEGWRPGPGGGWWLGRALVLPEDAALPAELAALPPLEARALEQRRLQLGIPAAPAELNDDTNPFELGLADRVSLSKGCYVGQETLAKLATYDGVKQQLRCWRAGAGPVAPEPGLPLRGPGGERAGVITSALALPAGEGWLGLALVRRAALDQPQLWAGEGAPQQGLQLAITVPPLFVPPPLGAGRPEGS